MVKKNKKTKIKEKIKDIINSYKTIIYISFMINIILLILLYNTMTSNQIYTFSGEDDYLKIKDGLIILNNDINLLNGNNIEYIYNTDYDIKTYKIGYYVMDGSKLVEIFSSSLEPETEIKLSELVNKFTTLNLSEKDSSKVFFTKYKKKLIEKGLYLVMEAKTKDGKEIVSKVNLNVSKISKH